MEVMLKEGEGDLIRRGRWRGVVAETRNQLKRSPTRRSTDKEVRWRFLRRKDRDKEWEKVAQRGSVAEVGRPVRVRRR